MGFTNRVDVYGRQKMLEAPHGSPQSSSRAQQDGEGNGGRRRQWLRAMRSIAGARGRRPVRARASSAGEGGRYGEAIGFIAKD